MELVCEAANSTRGLSAEGMFEYVSREMMAIKIRYSFLFPIVFHVLGCGTTGFATDRDSKPRDAKDAGENISSPATTGEGVSMRVLWTVSDYKPGKDAVWGDEEARSLLFKPLDMDSNSITFDGNRCSDVIFNRESVRTDDYLERVYHVSPHLLGIKDEAVEVVSTNCTIPGFAEFIRLRDRRLIIHVNGLFFFFEPALNY